jgi:hypothetical protein
MLRSLYLVRAANEVQVVAAQELGHNVFSKGEGDPAVVLPPPDDVLVRVRPDWWQVP